MEERINVDLAADDDGFVSQECPACERRFKIVPGEGSDKPVSFCPYCRHNGHDCWWTPEQAKYLSAIIGEQVFGPELDQMAREFNRGSSGGFIRMSAQITRPHVPVRPDEPTVAWPIVHFACCNERIKYDDKDAQVACVICGVQAGVGAA
jgi:hypothetical protein